MQDAGGMAYEVPLISVRYARHFVRFMEARGIGRQALLFSTDIDEGMLDNPEAFLSMRQITQMLSQGGRLLPDERLPFEFGKELDLMGHGLLGFALLNQRDHQELIRMCVQYLRVCLPMMDMRMRCGDKGICIRLEDIWELGELRPFMAKIYMGSIYSLSSLICRHFTFEFDFPSNLEMSGWDGCAQGGELHFNAEYNQATMALSDRPARDGDTEIAYYLADARSRLQAQPDTVVEVVMRVRQQIMKDPGRDSTLERVAEKLGMSARSVRRHLGLAGFSFHDIRTDIRETFATLYLADTRVPLEKIAERLGYSDQASFTKAYRGWTGRTPGSVRRWHQARASRRIKVPGNKSEDSAAKRNLLPADKAQTPPE